MNIDRRTFRIAAVLFFLIVAALFISQEVKEESEPPAFEYIVRTGDTCAKLAVGFNVSVISIVKANNLKRDCSNIYAGQALFIPYPTPTPLGSPMATVREVVIDCERENYTVKAGDTLEGIANKYNIPKDAIVFFNGLTRNQLEAGMQLAIPLCYPTPDP